jgi:hypothetical protein
VILLPNAPRVKISENIALSGYCTQEADPSHNSLYAHALSQIHAGQLLSVVIAGILAALIRMMEQARIRLSVPLCTVDKKNRL